MSAVLFNVAIGILTSVLSGTGVWAWQRLANVRRLARERRFLGISANRECIIVIGHQMQNTAGIHRADVNAVIEVGGMTNDLGGRFRVLAPDQYRESIGSQVEFCVNGPDANARTKGHMENYLRGVHFRPYRPGHRDSIAIVAGEEEFIRERDRQEYAILARIRIDRESRPLFLLAGQTAVTNHAAAFFLRSRIRQMDKEYGFDRNFCLILSVDQPMIYGHSAVRLKSDVTDVAFADPSE
ncbi:hypothetical protein [Frankia tisae]|uniref:hypothetical protein n=1 Tax=Frankia tisae TaxID=2950104 RepID=UPI0021BE3DA2|nr:hypothetical protein [Frankia tisae]